MRSVGFLHLSRPRTVLRRVAPRPGAGLAFAAPVLALAAPQAAHAGAGGVSLAPSAVTQAHSILVRKISCIQGCSAITAAQPGATLRFQGPMLQTGKRVVYLGGAGSSDDVLAALHVKKSGGDRVVTALVPKRAVSGPVAIEVAAGARSKASSESVTLPATVANIPAADLTPIAGVGPFFPIRGDYKFGTGVAAFGGARHHQGEDVFAKCGTPLVAAEGGTVIMNAFQARAGNYLAIDVDGDTHDEAYMHLRDPALPPLGTHIVAGTPIGFVGDTGDANGCHLHFEFWVGHWQGIGGAGTAVDPLATLKLWAAGPGAAAAKAPAAPAPAAAAASAR